VGNRLPTTASNLLPALKKKTRLDDTSPAPKKKLGASLSFLIKAIHMGLTGPNVWALLESQMCWAI